MEIFVVSLYLVQVSVVLGNLCSGSIFSTKTSFWLNLIPFYYMIYIQRGFLMVVKILFKDSIEEYNKLV